MVCGGVTPGESLGKICSVLGQLAPLRLAEDWDNVGLLVGDREAEISRVMTCLTISPDVVQEAIDSGANLIIAHHPLPFRPVAKITSDTVTGEMLLKVIGSGIAIYSAHTAFDSASGGINQTWATGLGLNEIEPLVPSDANTSSNEPGKAEEGAGRVGLIGPGISLSELSEKASQVSGAPCPRQVDSGKTVLRKVAIACGSGGSFLSAAARRGADVLVTGEATFHTCLEARSRGISLVLLGHYWSERFAMDQMAKWLGDEIEGIEVWASKVECDPLHTDSD